MRTEQRKQLPDLVTKILIMTLVGLVIYNIAFFYGKKVGILYKTQQILR